MRSRHAAWWETLLDASNPENRPTKVNQTPPLETEEFAQPDQIESDKEQGPSSTPPTKKTSRSIP